MTSKERVKAALRREAADRVPVFMWFHPETARSLGCLLEIAPAEVPFAMGNDICQKWVGNNYAMEGIVHCSDGEGHLDDWGVQWVRYDGFNQVAAAPLAGLEAAKLRAYRFPLDRLEELLRPMRELEPWRREYFVGCDVSPCVFELLTRICGMEPALLALAEDTPEMRSLIERCGDFSSVLADTACERCAPDWLWTGDDIGGQQGMMLSPAMWRERIKPQLQRVFDAGRRHGLPVAYHSCGSIRPVIGDLVEMGLTVLNPLQCNCPGMAAAELKEEFGSALTFMGGVDTQHLLVHAPAAEVYRTASELIATMTADGGGYILAASHTVPPETPTDNIFALFAAAGITREEIFDRAAGFRAGGSAGAPFYQPSVSLDQRLGRFQRPPRPTSEA